MTGNRAARRGLTVLRELALTGGAVAGALCLLFALLGATAGVRPLVFTSGSMTPTIRTGDLAITRPVELDLLDPGDVVSVLDARGMRVTHRVLDVDTARHLLRLKGDANDVADPFPYPADRVDRVLFAVPAGGYLLTWSGRPTALLLLGAYLAFGLCTLWGRGPLWTRASSIKPAQRPGRRPGRHRAGSVIGAGLALGLSAGALPQPAPTLAAWADSVPVTGTGLTAYTMPKPVLSNCSRSLLNITVTWAAVSTPYALTYQAVIAETGQTLTVTGSGGTRSAVHPTTVQTVVGATHTIRITAALPATAAWTSAPANQTVNLPLLDVAPSCGASS